MVIERSGFRPKPVEKQTTLKAEYNIEQSDMPEFIQNLFKNLELKFGTSAESNMNQFYNNLRGNFIVRREYPLRLLESLLHNQDIQMNFDSENEKPYANSVEWSSSEGSRGLENTFMEGFSHLNGLVLVAGYRKGKDMKIEHLKDSQDAFYDHEKGYIDRTLVRSLSGTIHPNDVAFVVARIPTKFVEEQDLTESEEERDAKFIFRGFNLESSL